MVGVPRSKGCATCRRRKVACDQTKPHCKACQKRGVECEGYTRYPTVLQWTPNGLKKRQRFEEVVAPEGRPPQNDALVVRNGSSTGRAPSSAEYDFSVAALPRPTALGFFILQQIQTKCYETYLPPNGQVMVDVKQTWMYTMNHLVAPGEALSASFSALSLARVGIVMKDDDLVTQGRGQYALALTKLQKALYDPELAFEDRTLAAMRTLSIYEILVPTYSSVPPGKVHERGMAQWCRAAGPRSIKTHFAMQLFQDVRWSLMTHGIDSRKASILGSEEWLTIPWENFEKDCLQELFDIGFDVAAFLELVDSSLMSQDPGLLAQLPTTCFSILEELDMWRDNNWPSRDASPWSDSGYGDVDASPPPNHRLTFGSLLEATSMICYWWFKLVLDEALSSLQPSTSRESSYFSDESSPVPDSLPIGQYASMALSSNMLTLATDIVRAAPVLLAEDTGWVGPQRMMFPLRAAIQHLGKVRSPVIVEAQTALKSLFARLRPRC